MFRNPIVFDKTVVHSNVVAHLWDNRLRVCRLVWLLGWSFLSFWGSSTVVGGAVDFESDLAPLLIRRCVECHQGQDPSGGLLLTTREGLQAGGESGQVVDLQHVDESVLLQRVLEGEMPPEKQGRPQTLPDDEIKLIREWLADGAVWPDDRELDYFERTNDVRAGRDWWSLQPVVRPDIPRLLRLPQPENPIDAFVWAKLETKNIVPASAADRRTLLRRLYHDLIGLPPTEKEIQDFLADDTSDAWVRVIDRLLEMPQYGERWGRFWLDLARYADTSGYERDQEKPFAWKYRDWVVDAFNSDMPYDQFVMQQIAGDELPDRSEASVIATGFLRLGTWNDEPNDKLDYQYERLEDLVHTTSSTFLGLTVKCARCHSHKFDAITQEDYYRMASAFWGGPLLSGELGGPTAEQLGFENVLGWTDESPDPKALHILKNGERHHPLQKVIPGSLSSIPSLEHRFNPPPTGATSSHRRLQLARWIVHPENPLTSRVLVNRLWQHHFGRAIVGTPNNFGFLADAPTHPKLLDWLASEFDACGRRMKPLHRLILTSQTWQQSALHPHSQDLTQRDSENRLLWRSERRRLDAETLRDSLLAVSGELDLKTGGAGFKPAISPEALEGLSRKSAAWQASPPDQQKRRSLYMYIKRGLLPPMMTTFDLCDPTLSCGQRDVTIVPTQALMLLNNRFVHRRSEYLAKAIAEETDDRQLQIREAWSRVLQRQPVNGEFEAAERYLTTQTQTFLEQREVPHPSVGIKLREAIQDSLVLHLCAEDAVLSDDPTDRVGFVPDLSGQGHNASQLSATAQPSFRWKGIGEKPTLHFDGRGRFMHLAGQLLDSQQHTIICVVSDEEVSGHREILSNWNGSVGNSVKSLFLGLAENSKIRFSDAFTAVRSATDPAQPFILTAVNGSDFASVFQDGALLRSAAALPERRLDTSWVLGQQGNINGEFWKGGIAEIRVFNRALSDVERHTVELALAEHYGLSLSPLEKTGSTSPTILALASLCHALMNSNEFLFVD
jgi:hypothetical protein